jgi:hypothetical protein
MPKQLQDLPKESLIYNKPSPTLMGKRIRIKEKFLLDVLDPNVMKKIRDYIDEW